MEIRESQHFFKRWKERVDSTVERDQIKTYIKELAEKNLIECDFNNFYVLDDEIVIVAKLRQGYIDLLTVYGKISENPCLSNPRYIYETSKKYGRVKLTS